MSGKIGKASLVGNLRKRDLLDIYSHALDSIRPDRLIKNALTIKDDTLTIKNSNRENVSVNLQENSLHVIGGGKSALAMACGLAELINQAGFTHCFSNGILSLPSGLKPSLLVDKTRTLLDSIKVSCLFGSENNLPDRASVLASQALLENVKLACDRDRLAKKRPLFLVLISGGGSACLTSPRSISLEEKLQLIKFLVQKGADIVELNKVRRYFSNIKGGHLASLILNCHEDSRILSLIVSDVIGDPIEYIASGPTYIDRASKITERRQLMLDVLAKYGYVDYDKLFNQPEEHDAELSADFIETRVVNRIIGNNTIALEAARERAKLLGYNVECLGSDLHGSSDEVVERITQFGDNIFQNSRDNTLVIGGGETTVSKLKGETWGKGGRAQEMVMDYMIFRMRRKSLISETIDVFLAGGTDGQDGPTDVAACMASYAEWAESSTIRKGDFSLEELQRAKSSHNSNNFWNQYKPEWLIKTGLTGSNVMDLYMFLLSNK